MILYHLGYYKVTDEIVESYYLGTYESASKRANAIANYSCEKWRWQTYFIRYGDFSLWESELNENFVCQVKDYLTGGQNE